MVTLRAAETHSVGGESVERGTITAQDAYFILNTPHPPSNRVEAALMFSSQRAREQERIDVNQIKLHNILNHKLLS